MRSSATTPPLAVIWPTTLTFTAQWPPGTQRQKPSRDERTGTSDLAIQAQTLGASGIDFETRETTDPQGRSIRNRELRTVNQELLKENALMSFTSRRSFLKASAAATATIASRRLSAATLNMPVGLQLYSVRDLLPKDFDGTLHKVAAAGYTEVEAAGYYKRPAAQFRHSMDQAGLRCISTHHSMSDLSPRLDELIEYGHNLGLTYIVCPSPTRKDPKARGELNLDDWRWVAGELNRIGEKVKAAGMTFGYHNHGPEFGTEGGVVFYDELLRLTDPKLVVFEMDCGWVYSAGRNPLDYLRKTPEPFPLQ